MNPADYPPGYDDRTQPHDEGTSPPDTIVHCPVQPCSPWGFFAVLVLMVFVGVAAFYDHMPARQAEWQQKHEERRTHQREQFRDQAVAMLPPGAIEVAVIRDEYPTGWLTFVRVEGATRAKYLVCYQWVDAVCDVRLTVTRAD